MRRLLLSLCWLSWLVEFTGADGQFTEPDGRRNDLEEKFTVGDTLNIKWVAGWYGSDTQPDFVDLFITWFRSDSFNEPLLSEATISQMKINVLTLVVNTTTKQPGFLPWKINVTEDVVNADNAFVLRFRPHRNRSDWNNTGPMAPSRGFILQFASSSSSIPTATPTSTLASNTGLATTTASSTASAGTKDGSSTNVSAIVGGIIGGLAVIALCAVAYWLRRLVLRKKELQAIELSSSNGDYPPPIVEAESQKYYRMAHRAELDAQQEPVEVGSGQERKNL